MNAINCLCGKPGPETPPLGVLCFADIKLPLYVYLFELVQDEQASLDLVQETFINAARHIEGLREDDKVRQLALWHRPSEVRAALAQANTRGKCFGGSRSGSSRVSSRSGRTAYSSRNEEAFLRFAESIAASPAFRVLLRFVEDFFSRADCRDYRREFRHGEVSTTLWEKGPEKTGGGENIENTT